MPCCRPAAFLFAILLTLLGLSLYAADKEAADAQPETAENAGQADFDEALVKKLAAENTQELSEVIGLCQKALDKGLDKKNAEFAKKLLASTLYQRGKIVADAIFAPGGPDPRWPQWRQLALRDLERSVEHDAQQPQCYLLITKLNVLPGGDRKRAISAADHAVKEAGDDVDSKFTALMMRAGLDAEPEKRLADLNAAIELKPSEVAPLRARGALKAAMHKPEEALVDLEAAIKLDPKNPSVFEVQGLALAMLKRFDESRESYRRALELAPNSVPALVQRAQVSYVEEKFEETIADTSKALNIDPENIPALLLRAQARMRSDKIDDALADVDAVLAEEPSLPQALRLRSMIRGSRGKIKEAIADLESIIAHNPKDLEVLVQLALLYRNQKKFDKTFELFDTALKIEPGSWFIHYGRGDAYLSVGKHKEAIADYEAAYKAQPKDGNLLNNFAWVLATSPDESVRDGKRAIELATAACEVTEYKRPNILSTLGAAYAETGDFETALKWARKGLELADEDSRKSLQKEIENYEAQRPVREILHEDLPVTQAPTNEQKR
jgi:tetratricopeptide (TPR) repeat protein